MPATGKEDKMKNEIKRRKFFGILWKSAAGVALLNAIPLKSLFARKNEKTKLKVKIHPNAVSRNRKGLAG